MESSFEEHGHELVRNGWAYKGDLTGTGKEVKGKHVLHKVKVSRAFQVRHSPVTQFGRDTKEVRMESSLCIFWYRCVPWCDGEGQQEVV